MKAAAGGGGKGMRIVRSAGDLDAAVAAAKREAQSAFGDDTLLLEKYVEHGRHLEVQVLADTHGTVLHLFERDCSTQRRHQKVIEEAPAPTIDDDLRHRLTSAAVHLAREVGYVNAGTVEFLLDTDTLEFYFLEMNTRLQVEHPVTELICGGLDLVEHQLRIAAGEPLALTQDDLRIQGHAMEARVYAEDAFGGFLPQAGTTSIVRWPTGAGVRVDHALESNQVVSTSYDPMLGKVIVHGPDRESARHALVAALDDTAVLGLTTNTGFLRALAASDAFRDATIDTAWLDAVDLETEVPRPDDDLPRLLVAWTSAMITALDAGHPFQADGFRLGGSAAPTLVELDRDVVVDRAAGAVDGVPVHQVSAEDHVMDLVVDGHRVRRRGQRAARRRRGGLARAPARVHAAGPARRSRGGHRRHRHRADAWLGPRCPRPGRWHRGRGRRARHPGGDEDGAGPEGAVRGHRGRGRRRGRRPGGARSRALRGGGGAVSVTIYEVGPRDGLQNESALVPTEVKAEFVRRLLAAGLPVVEATSFVHPRWVPQLADAEELMAALGDRGRDLPVLVPNERGLDRALALGLRHVAIFGSATETFARKNLNRSLDEQFAMFEPTVARAREAGLDVRAYVSMCFGDPWEGRSRSSRWSPWAPACSTSARAGSASGTRSAWARRSTSRTWSRPSATPVSAPTRWRCTSTTPTARRWPTRTPPSRRASPPSTPARGVWAAVRTPRAPPATSPPRTWCGC